MAYLYLTMAIICEVVATSALKASAEFTKIIPVLVIALGYGLSFYFMTLVLKTIPLGITYAIWSGLGIVVISAIGVVFYKEPLDLPAVVGIGLILAGVVVVNLFSKTAGH